MNFFLSLLHLVKTLTGKMVEQTNKLEYVLINCDYTSCIVIYKKNLIEPKYSSFFLLDYTKILRKEITDSKFFL